MTKCGVSRYVSSRYQFELKTRGKEMDNRTRKTRYLRLEDEDDLVLPQLGLSKVAVSVSKVAYKPSILLPKLNPDGRKLFKLIAGEKIDDVRDFLRNKKGFNINCQNYAGSTPLTKAVSNGNINIVNAIISQPGVIVGDSVLHAVNVGNVSIITALLDKITASGKDERAPCGTDSPDFDPDMTPIVLAATKGNYEVIRLLLSRGHFIDKPHRPDCFCPQKCWNKKEETLKDSITRFTTYTALANPAYMCQSSSDPIMTAFELSREFYKISKIERELVDEYLSLSRSCKMFAVDLLAVTRTTDEVALILKQKYGYLRRTPVMFSRLVTAVDLNQKDFVAHPNCQAVLSSVWLQDWEGYKTLSNFQKAFRLMPRILFMSVLALIYIVAPRSKYAQFWKSPANKYWSTTASYVTFLFIIVGHNVIDSQHSKRGFPNTGLEFVMGAFVLGFIWTEIKRLWLCGFVGYYSSKWNIYLTLMFLMFISTFSAWIWAYENVREHDKADLERKYWHTHDPTLIADGLFSIATVLAFGRLLYFLQIDNNCGPLEVSISRMFKDIACFMVIFCVTLISFTIGMHKLYRHYDTDAMYHDVHGMKVIMLQHFDTFKHSLYTLIWAIFSMSPIESTAVVLKPYGGNKTHPLINTHDFTEGVGHFLFIVYHVISIIILLNLLIAMMAHSFKKVNDNADREWKFARTRVWLAYFDKGGTLPSPFNLIPTPKAAGNLLWWCFLRCRKDAQARFSSEQCCYIEEEAEPDYEGDYQLLMARLVQRYLRLKENQKEKMVPNVAEINRLETYLKELQYSTGGGAPEASSTTATLVEGTGE